MVTGDPALEGMGPDGAEPQTPEEPKAIEGRSLRQIAVSRLKRDKATLAAMTIAALFVLVAIIAPILVKLKILDPLTNHQDLINAVPRVPGAA